MRWMWRKCYSWKLWVPIQVWLAIIIMFLHHHCCIFMLGCLEYIFIRILTGSYDCNARIWSTSGQMKTVVAGHKAAVKSVAWLQNGNIEFIWILYFSKISRILKSRHHSTLHWGVTTTVKINFTRMIMIRHDHDQAWSWSGMIMIRHDHDQAQPNARIHFSNAHNIFCLLRSRIFK